jgi:hypothetical protein
MPIEKVHPASLLKGLFMRRNRNNGGSATSDFELKTARYVADVHSAIAAIFKQSEGGVPTPLKDMVDVYGIKVTKLASDLTAEIWAWATSLPGYTGDERLTVVKDALVQLTFNGDFQNAQALSQAIAKGDITAAEKLLLNIGQPQGPEKSKKAKVV